MRRLFTLRQRLRLLHRAGGLCERCGTKLHAANFEADHHVPYSRGGPTLISNGTALCKTCNRKKGNKAMSPSLQFTPRKWQRDAIDNYFAPWLAKLHNHRTVFVGIVATGGGKTAFGAMATRHALDKGIVKRVVVIIGNLSTRRGWVESMKTQGLTVMAYANGQLAVGLPPDTVGTVTTYQSTQKPRALTALVNETPTMIIADEPHHVSGGKGPSKGARSDEAKAWAAGVKTASEGAVFTMLLTATPNRSDNDPMPWPEIYDISTTADGRKVYTLKPDYEYTYNEGLDDGILRPIFFRSLNAQGRWRRDDKIVEADLLAPLPKKDWGDRLASIVKFDADSATALVAEGVEALEEIRKDDPRAAMLVITEGEIGPAEDGKWSTQVARSIVKLHGLKTVEVHSDIEAAHAKIDAFRTSRDPVLVSIAMVAEGVDIPRIRVVVWLARRVTFLLFVQVAGRALRFQADSGVPHDKQHAVMVMPADPRLEQFAQVFREPVKTFVESKDGKPGDGSAPGERRTILPGSATDDGVRAVNAATGALFTADQRDYAERFKRDKGLLGLAVEQVAEVLRAVGALPAANDPQQRATRTREADHQELRDAVASARNRAFARCNGSERAQANLRTRLGQINKVAGLPAKGGIDIASREQLQFILDRLGEGLEGEAA
jgi:superfamily II DNA or RNA helicase